MEKPPQSFIGDVLAGLGAGWPLVTLIILLVYVQLFPPDPTAHLGSRPSEMRDVGSTVLAIGVLIAGVGLFATRRRTLKVLAFVGMCLNFLLAAGWSTMVY